MSKPKRKTAVVTGGLAGIGLVVAQTLSKNGFRVTIGARRGGDPEQPAKLRDLLGDKALIRPLDVRDEGSVADFCKAVEVETGSIDVLVNATGVSVHRVVCGHPLAD